MPGLAVVIDSATVDRIIETTPNDARYFVGLMLWGPDDLEDEIRDGAWEVRPADIDTVLRTNSNGLWKSLEGPMVWCAGGLRPFGLTATLVGDARQNRVGSDRSHRAPPCRPAFQR